MKIKFVVILAAVLCVIFAGCESKSVGSTTVKDYNITPAPLVKKPVITKTPEATATPEVTKVDNPDFRNVKWGMTQDEVAIAEGPSTDYSDTYMAYTNLSVANISTSLGYFFNDSGQLYEAIYQPEENHTNKNDYLTDFDNVVAALTEKYGQPSESDTVWKDDLYKDDPSEWGMAVSAGHMVKYAKWETDRTSIGAIISGDNFEITTMIGYESKTIDKPADNSTDGL